MIARIFRKIKNTTKNGAPNVRINKVAGARPGITKKIKDKIPTNIPTTIDNGSNTILINIAARCSGIFMVSSLQADNQATMGNTLFCRVVDIIWGDIND